MIEFSHISIGEHYDPVLFDALDGLFRGHVRLFADKSLVFFLSNAQATFSHASCSSLMQLVIIIRHQHTACSKE